MTETALKQLPEAVVYEDGLAYWPYKKSLQAVLDYIVANAPRRGRLLDIMCGPGWLLDKIRGRRPDLSLVGVDADSRYVSYGSRTYPGITFIKNDILGWRPGSKYDVAVCTGALHHIPYEEQEDAVASIAYLVRDGGLAIISDCYIDGYTDETQRKLAAARLGYEYLCETIRNGAPDKVVGWTADILYNDVLMHEYKMSVHARLKILQRHFAHVTTTKVWPEEPMDMLGHAGYGDYVHLCSN